MNQALILKVLLIGDFGTGKKSIIKRYTEDIFQEEVTSQTPAGGIHTARKQLELQGNLIQLHICDTGGLERYGKVPRNLYHGVHGVILLYDITNPKSFESISTKWMKEIEWNARDNCSFIIAATKCDNLPSSTMTSTSVSSSTSTLPPFLEEKQNSMYALIQQGREIAAKSDWRFVEVSAKTAQNVDLLFQLLVQDIYRNIRNSDGGCVSIQLDSNSGNYTSRNDCC